MGVLSCREGVGFLCLKCEFSRVGEGLLVVLFVTSFVFNNLHSGFLLYWYQSRHPRYLWENGTKEV